MNNIEILEDYIEALRKPKPFKYTNEQKAQAIENLIQENKELKSKQCVYKDTSSCNKSLSFETYIKLNEYIPKSKVKEKIEELDKKMAEDEVDEFGIHSQGWAALDWTRDFLLKLLEEGE